MNKNRVLWGLLAFVLLFSVIFSSARAGEEKALTLIIYMAGSDLETQNGSASADIQEMLSSGCVFPGSTSCFWPAGPRAGVWASPPASSPPFSWVPGACGYWSDFL